MTTTYRATAQGLPHHIESILEIRRKISMKRYPLATARMGERQLTSVQPLPLQTQFLRKRGVATVE
uniref:hypothetical protein n=1 Tax=Klebsiella pneumoniae TaxID=573 RepID=UPI0024E051DD